MDRINLIYPLSAKNNQHTLGIIIKDVLQELGKEIIVIDSEDLKIQYEGSEIYFEKIRGGIYYLYNILFGENYKKLSPEIINRIEEFAHNPDNNELTTQGLIEILESGKKGNL